MTVTSVTRQGIIDFLFQEARLLDEWNLLAWADLFTEDATYLIPPIGEPDASPLSSLFYVHDSRSRLQERAERLLKKEAHVEYPHSTTIRNYHNILIDDESDPSIIKVACNFTTHRTKREMLDTFIGRAYFDLVQTKEGIRIQNKKVILYLDSLRPHGKISLIL